MCREAGSNLLELNCEELVLIARQRNFNVMPLPPAAVALSGLILECFASVDFLIAFLFKDLKQCFSISPFIQNLYHFRTLGER